MKIKLHNNRPAWFHEARVGRLICGVLFALLGLFVVTAVRAGGGSCNYLVLYDQNDTDSVAVANYYQQSRAIPERNMVPYTFFPPGRTTFPGAICGM